MGFVLIQHLDPRHESHLASLLHRSNPMPIAEATDGMTVEPNHVYIIPPNVNLSLFHGTFQLTPRAVKAGIHMPIDHFFRSLAEEEKSRAIGVILSGTASDGVM